nr:stress response protein NST1-like [Aegilops tauschii subsp. strangulata]
MGGSLLVNKEGEIDQSKPSPKTVQEPPRPPELSNPPSTEGGTRALPPASNSGDRVAAGWPDVMEEALNSSSVIEEHRALMGMVLQSIWSVNSELKEAFGGLLTGFEKLKISDEELDIVNKRFVEEQVVTAEVENLKAELEKAKQEIAEQKAAAKQAAANLSVVKTISDKHEARVAEVQQELKDAVTKCEGLEEQKKDRSTELTSLMSEVKEAQTEAQSYKQELRQVRLIVDDEKVKTTGDGIKLSSKEVVQEHNENILEGMSSIKDTMKTPMTGGQQSNPKIDASKTKGEKGHNKHKQKKSKVTFAQILDKYQKKSEENGA